MRYAIICLLAVGVGLADLGSAPAAFVVDPAGDFLPSYTGPRNGDLDVLNTEVSLLGGTFRFTALLNGAIGTTPGAFYVWGLDRGLGTARFGALAPGVLFDSVLLLRPDGTGQFNDLIAGSPVILTPGAVTISGNRISGSISASLVTPRGFTPDQFTFNLWPRVNGGTQPIADFAPDNSNAVVTSAPAPAGVAVLALGGLTALLGLRRRLA